MTSPPSPGVVDLAGKVPAHEIVDLKDADNFMVEFHGPSIRFNLMRMRNAVSIIFTSTGVRLHGPGYTMSMSTHPIHDHMRVRELKAQIRQCVKPSEVKLEPCR